MKYAFFLDIDGTLTWGSSVPSPNIEVIKRARKDGHLVLLNTGRSLGFIPRFVLDTVELDGIVAGSGSYCSLGGKVIKAEEIPKDTLKAVFDYFLKKGRSFFFEAENTVLVHNKDRKSPEFPAINSSEELYGIYKDVRVEKINIPGVLDKEEFEFLDSMLFALQQYDYAECALKGLDKAVGMKIVMDALPPDFKSVAVGDSFNDIEMLEAADVSAAMGNAPDKVKALCDIVTRNAKDAGLAEAFIKILGYSDMQF